MKVPKGDKFLPDVSIDELRILHKKEKNAKARDRLLAYMARKDGSSVQAISNVLNRATTTIYDWLCRTDDGLDGLYDIKRQGPARKLTDKQLAELREDLLAGPQAHGFESNLWTGKTAARHVLNKYKVRYVPRTMQTLLHEVGFRHVTPRPRHPKAASAEEKKAFKKKASWLATYYHNRGYKILAGDEASHILGWNLQRGWYHEDAPRVAPVTLSRKRFYSVGALGSGTLYCRFYDKMNTENYIDFLTRTYDEYGKFVMFLDNASYHKSKTLKKFLEGMEGKIKICYFPPYTPELNPSEVQWKSFRKATGNRLYEDVEEMQESINAMLQEKEIPIVKTFDYLDR